MLELDGESCRDIGTVPSGRVLVDGYGVGDVGSIVLRDRKHLAEDGLIVVVATVDLDEATIVSGPDLISRGFVHVRESEELMDDVRELVRGVLCDTLDSGITEWTQMKTTVKDALSKYLYQKTKRKPMILPVIMNVYGLAAQKSKERFHPLCLLGKGEKNGERILTLSHTESAKAWKGTDKWSDTSSSGN